MFHFFLHHRVEREDQCVKACQTQSGPQTLKSSGSTLHDEQTPIMRLAVKNGAQHVTKMANMAPSTLTALLSVFTELTTFCCRSSRVALNMPATWNAAPCFRTRSLNLSAPALGEFDIPPTGAGKTQPGLPHFID